MTADIFEVFYEHFCTRIIGLDYPSHFQGVIEWPQFSPDLNPCDFYLWDYLNSKRWQTNPKTFPELKAVVTNAVGTIHNEVSSRLMDGFQNRLIAIFVKEGGHFETLYH
ncbi:hypothetical protein AVEN_230847-1 [Araneus ventricosus]|uniref:Tc1-like transposase DDE domain-containing protein n=1 Tax=Araneus ventricosus TaxID=182803 RepID=A0A4Y2A2F4_ARAVE|nr:hypothetical protein AVEN_230847-1 [Araneus ventricosus]